MYYRIRVDQIEGVEVEDFEAICEPKVSVLVHHILPTGNPHYHYLIDTDVKENTLRQRIKRKYPSLKSTDYSIKKADDERINEYVQYLFNTKHGNKSTLISANNFDNDILEDLKKQAQKVSDEYDATKSRHKVATMYELAEEIHRQVNKTFTIDDLGTTALQDHLQLGLPINIEEYVDATMMVCRKHRKGFDEFMVRKLITTALAQSAKGRLYVRSRILTYYLDK